MFAAKLYCDYNDTVLKLLLYCYIFSICSGWGSFHVKKRVPFTMK